MNQIITNIFIQKLDLLFTFFLTQEASTLWKLLKRKKLYFQYYQIKDLLLKKNKGGKKSERGNLNSLLKLKKIELLTQI